MERFVCIHGHFYQPPRENPWLEVIELQDSAYPYHDWNERITAECYAPNSVARILDADGKIVQLVNNYARISFNIGPTLLAWLQDKAPDVYQRILEADRESQKRFSGHGSALAQVYNHVIMPLASRRDKITQTAWGIRDFRTRYGREPEGMWLPETAVDLETLDVLAEQGIRFTILAPAQAAQVRKLGADKWEDVRGGRIDITQPYLQRLPSGRSIALFFYHDAIARGVAFEGMLAKGEDFAQKLAGAYTDSRPGPQLVHIATDGESYGHHHPHGDMALASALHHIEAGGAVRLTNYAEFLERFPPQFEVQIQENTSWSCTHGIERWRADCGCNSGRRGWRQAWRGPLRQALDWLRDAVAAGFEQRAAELLSDPWAARNDYVRVVLDRGPESVAAFFADHARRDLDDAQRRRALELLELQRHLLLMYTSCGWFFDEISGLETVQVLMYAGRAIQLAEQLLGQDFKKCFLDRLEKAPSNLRLEHKTGRHVFAKFVEPARVDWSKIGAHFAASSLFEPYPKQTRLFSYSVERENDRAFEAGKVKLTIGHARFTSEITQESERLGYAALHFGDHNVHGGVRPFDGEPAYAARVQEFAAAFEKVDYPQIVRLIDKHFGGSSFALDSLFKDEQRKVLKRVLRAGLTEATSVYSRLYEQNLPLMRFLKHVGAPLPLTFRAATEVLFNTDLRWAFADDDPDFDHIRNLIKEAEVWEAPLDVQGLSYKFTRMLARTAERWREQPTQLEVLHTLNTGVELANSLPFEPDLWKVQNVYFELMPATFVAQTEAAQDGDDGARQWLDQFLQLGDKLHIHVDDLKKKAPP